MKTYTEKQSMNPALLNSYKLMKKIIKYSLYILIFYFAVKGFMA